MLLYSKLAYTQYIATHKAFISHERYRATDRIDKTGTKSFTAKHLSWDLRTRDDLGNRCPVSP